LGVFGNVVRGITAKLSKEHKPSIGEVYKAGRLLGLDEEDISSLVHRKGSPYSLSFIDRHWVLILLLTIIGIALIVFYVLLNTSGAFSGTYPAGTRYGVISTRDFRRRHLLSEEENAPLDPYILVAPITGS
jgi:hypothetical protein